MSVHASVAFSEDKLRDLCTRYQVRAFYLFGSAARNEMGPDSDVDVLVEFQPNHQMDLFDFGHLQDELTALAGRRVDLVSKRGMNRSIAPHILKDAQLLSAT